MLRTRLNLVLNGSPLRPCLAGGLALLAVTCGFLATPLQARDSLTPGTRPNLAVPAYVYGPVPTYEQLAQNAPAVGLVVANVDSGPGLSPSPEWAAAIDVAHRAGVAVLAYVDTGYIGTTGQTTRPPTPSTAAMAWRSQVQNDVDTWYRFYGRSLDGIFFDQGPALCGPSRGDHSWIDFYADAFRYVKGRHPRARVAVNPGQVPDQCYARAADTLVTFEGSYSTYVDQDLGRTTPAWIRKSPPQRTWHLVYGVRQPEIGDVIARTRAANAGYLYTTSLALPNPWASLPADDYWNEELVRAGAAVDTRPPTAPRHVRPIDVSFDRLIVAWDGSRDDIAVAAYDVYLGTTLVATVHGTEATLGGLAPGTYYTIAVRARDPAGNRSPAGTIGITTRLTDPASVH